MIFVNQLEQILSENNYEWVQVTDNIYLCEAGNTVLTWTVEGAEVIDVDAAVIFKPNSLSEIADYITRGKWH